MAWFSLLGRLLFGGFFLFSGFNHFANTDALATYAGSHGVPEPELAVLLSGLLLTLGGASVLLGVAPRIGLGLLIAFLVPVTLAMHDFWNVTDPQQRAMEMVGFMKNVALTGAASLLMALPLPWTHALDEVIRRHWPDWDRWTDFHRPAHPR